jgi:hypothetical protein
VPADPFAEWQRVVAALQERSGILYGHYSRARLLGWNDAGIELGTASFLATDADTVKELTRLVGEILGAPVAVRVKSIPAEKPGAPEKVEGKSVAEVEAARDAAERAQREKEARAHPLTEKVIQTFGASIKDIKLDG